MENQFTHTSPESITIPPGYKFCPTKKELIDLFLIKKIFGETIPRNPIKDCDIYGDPKIWRNLFEKTGMKTHYFYTKPKYSQRGKRVRRTTGSGTWEGQGCAPIYDDDAKHIGSRRRFSFAEKEGLEPNVGWSMLEYRLDGINQNIPNEVSFFLFLVKSFFFFLLLLMLLVDLLWCVCVCFFVDLYTI